MIRIETKEAVGKMRKEFSHLSGREFNKGVSRALNRTIMKVRTEASRSIRKNYKLPAKEVKKHTKLKRSRPNYLVAEIVYGGRPIPLKHFKPRQTAKGVSVNITGTRKTIRSAFIATMPSGHIGVYARGKYGGSRGFVFRKNRVRTHGHDLPITELMTTSVPIMAANNDVVKQVTQTANDMFPKRLEHELGRLSGFK